MRKLTLILPLGLLGLFLTRCGPLIHDVPREDAGVEPDEITVADLPDKLTRDAGDPLFTLTLVKAAADYPITEVMVTAGLPGETATALVVAHGDTNGDAALNPGETLTCKESVVDLFDATTVGQQVDVSLRARTSGTYRTVATTTWKPAN